LKITEFIGRLRTCADAEALAQASEEGASPLQSG